MDVWNKLSKNQNFTPLLHRAWRQPVTTFENPQYVNLTTVNLPENESIENILLPDLSLVGKVALSKGRYTHFGHKLNFIRQTNNDNDRNNMVFSINERKQVKSEEMHYFDNAWFGTIVKITEFKGQ